MKIAALLLAVCAVLCRGADNPPYDCFGLRGISSVIVSIKDLDAGAGKISLTKDAIRTDVELRLRIANLKVVEAGTLLDVPFLYVEVHVMDNARAANVRLELMQGVVLTRSKTAPSVVVPHGQEAIY